MSQEGTIPRILLVCAKRGIRAAIAKALIEKQAKFRVSITSASFEPENTSEALIKAVEKVTNTKVEQEVETVFNHALSNNQFDAIVTICENEIEDHKIFNACVGVAYPSLKVIHNLTISEFYGYADLASFERKSFIEARVERTKLELEQLFDSDEFKSLYPSQACC